MTKTYQAAVLTISDSTSAGLREDKSGDALVELLQADGFIVTHREVLPDEQQVIQNALTRCCAIRNIDFVVTTGGTGVSERDVTPEATAEVLEKVLPGMAEAMRQESLKYTPYTMLSRQMAGVARGTLIINFPGSEKAVRQCFDVVRPVLNHTLDLIGGHTEHNA